MPLSWVDIIMPLVMLRCLLTGRKSGLIVEAFKLAGILCGTFITLHYYSSFGNFLDQNLSLYKSMRDVYAFGLLAIGVHLLFSLIREGWLIILKIEMPAFLDRLGGVILSGIRAYLICGLIFLALLTVKDDHIQSSAKNSFSALFLEKTSIGIYHNFYFGFIHNFFPNEPVNKEVSKLVTQEKGK